MAVDINTQERRLKLLDRINILAAIDIITKNKKRYYFLRLFNDVAVRIAKQGGRGGTVGQD